jgi:hypothetical protein
VTLLRVINEAQKGTDRIDCFLGANVKDRTADQDRKFSLHERGAEAPELVVHDFDVKGWLGPVLLALATQITPDGDAATLQ